MRLRGVLGSRRARTGLITGAAALAGAGAALAAVALREGRASRPAPEPAVQPAPAATLAPFTSDAELRSFIRRKTARQRAVSAEAATADASMEMAAPASPAPDQITNTQEAGVDEGGIVKARGDLLVMLRRGRLFTVSTAGGGLRPVDAVDAYPPGVSVEGAWYDEMLLVGDRVVVIGYSYERGGTEINRFRLDADGRLRFEDAHHLRSNDYYSSRNYASRLIGETLVLYSPLYLDYQRDPLEALPGLRRWTGDEEGAFKRIAAARDVYVAPILRDARSAEIDTLHTVIRCDLAAPVLDCGATGVLGPSSRNFYVSRDAVYLWVSDAWGYDSPSRRAASFLFRMPLAGEAPAGIATRGAPVDQFSFREDARDRTLDVLVRSSGGGDAMWRPEFSEGAVALLRLPLAALGDGSAEASDRFYRDLPRPVPDGYDFKNRFVGEHLLYGASFHDPEVPHGQATLTAAPVRGGPVAQLRLPHDIGRIEALGGDAMVVGNGAKDLFFTAIDLRGAPTLGDSYRHAAAFEAETRSHAFFYRPEAADGASGVLGLPVSRAAPPRFHRLFHSRAEMMFLTRRDRRLSPLGVLPSDVTAAVDDGCRASCVDWYGDARPIFLGDRIFALLGYELVEGSVSGGAIREMNRISFAPPPRR